MSWANIWSSQGKYPSKMRFFGFSVVVILKIVRVKNKMEIKHEKENIIEAILKLKYENWKLRKLRWKNKFQTKWNDEFGFS